MDIPSIVIKGVQSLEDRNMYLAESSYKSINPKVWQIPTKTLVTLCIWYLRHVQLGSTKKSFEGLIKFMLSHLVSLNHASLKIHENPNLPSFLQKEHQSNLHSGIFHGVASPMQNPPDRSKILPLMGQHHPTSWVRPMKASRNYRNVHTWILTWNPTIMVDFFFSCFSMWCFSTVFRCLLNFWSCVIFLHCVFHGFFQGFPHWSIFRSPCHCACTRAFTSPSKFSNSERDPTPLFSGGFSTKLLMDILDGCYGFLFDCIQKLTISIHGTYISTYMKTIKNQLPILR